MTFFNRQRWSRLSSIVGIKSVPEDLYDTMERRYSEPHRGYHNARHIDECLQEFDFIRQEALSPAALELAIWFHDVIYDPRASNNEEQSAGFAIQCLQGVSSDLARLVSDLILTTKTHRPGTVQDTALLLDVDLSILGKPPDRFAEFEEGIRKEFAWVPFNVYCEKRAEILRGFLNRERIYVTKFFHDRYEATARKNILKLIAELERKA